MTHEPPLGTDPNPWLTRSSVLLLATVGLLASRSAGQDGRAAQTKPASAPAGAKPQTPSSTVEHPPGIIGIGRAIFDRFSRNNIMLVAASIAFYILGALFPALAAMISVYGLFADPQQVVADVQGLGNVLPPEALKIITDGISGFAQKSGSQLSVALTLSVVLALWSARTGISAVMTGLNVAYEEVEKRSFIMQTAVALALTLGGMVFAILAILALAVVPAALSMLHADGVAAQAVNIIRWPVLAAMVVLGFAVVYRYAPSRSNPSWKWITWGSGIATLLWIVGSALFSFYVSHFGSYDATYGALGSAVVLLMWFWVSATVLLIGAEIDAEVDARATKSGSPLAPLPAGGAGP